MNNNVVICLRQRDGANKSVRYQNKLFMVINIKNHATLHIMTMIMIINKNTKEGTVGFWVGIFWILKID